jgi:glycosyltransferase involved in cell wall biosynthesis
VRRILLDLRILRRPDAAGLARYASSLAPLLLTRDDAVYTFIGAPASGPLEGFGQRRVGLELPEDDRGTAEKLLALVGHLERADLLFSPYHPVPERRTCAAVLMVHDLLPLRHPEWFAPRTCAHFDGPLRRSARSATRLLVNSEWTKREVMELYGIRERKIAVVPLAASDAFRRNAGRADDAEREALAALGVRGPYLLAAATQEPRKNIEGVRKAYPELRRQFGVGLVIAGKYGWRAESALESRDGGSRSDGVVATGYVPDDQLALLYRHAEAFLYPSFCEGFGLPVLEAMASGTPVVTTSCGALPEVAGDAAAYCQPEDVSSIVRAVADILSNRRYRDELVARGSARADAFSWLRTAERTHSELLSCIDG